MTKIDLYLENKLLMLLDPIHRNYPKIIINNSPESNTTLDVKESTGYKAMLQSMIDMNKALRTFNECCSVLMSRYCTNTLYVK